MIVFGIMGSPRPKGNTDRLLSAFLEGAREAGAQVLTISVGDKRIAPCQGCRYCEHHGHCRLADDDMDEIYGLLRRADMIVAATPIFFYGPSAQIKALIDRSQTLWARRYVYKLVEPKTSFRKGFLLAVGATKGGQLFDGTVLTARYFFDAVSARFEGYLGFRQMEGPTDIELHPTALAETREKARLLTTGLTGRRRVLFVCRENACRSQMAEAFLQLHGGQHFDAESIGDQPAAAINPLVVEVMAEKHIDVAYRRPKGAQEILEDPPFAAVIQMGCEMRCPAIPAAAVYDWGLPDPAGQPIEFMRELRDSIEERVNAFIEEQEGVRSEDHVKTTG